MQNKANQTGQTASNNRVEDIRKDLPWEICSIWLGMRDSNPRSWDQNPLPYHLANPQCIGSFTSSRTFDLKAATNPSHRKPRQPEREIFDDSPILDANRCDCSKIELFFQHFLMCKKDYSKIILLKWFQGLLHVLHVHQVLVNL